MSSDETKQTRDLVKGSFVVFNRIGDASRSLMKLSFVLVVIQWGGLYVLCTSSWKKIKNPLDFAFFWVCLETRKSVIWSHWKIWSSKACTDTVIVSHLGLEHPCLPDLRRCWEEFPQFSTVTKGLAVPWSGGSMSQFSLREEHCIRCVCNSLYESKRSDGHLPFLALKVFVYAPSEWKRWHSEVIS